MSSTQPSDSSNKCCSCTDRSTCVRCICVKNKTACFNCIPNRQGHCANSLTSSCSQPIIQATEEIISQPSTKKVWGNLGIAEIGSLFSLAHETVVHWRPRMVQLPRSQPGKEVITQLTYLFRSFANDAAIQPIALKAVMVMPHLILQKTNDDTGCSISELIKRRLELWRNGNIRELLEEGQILQDRIKAEKSKSKTHPDKLRRHFSKLMQEGKISAAGNVVQSGNTGGVLDLKEKVGAKSVLEILQEKHPEAKPLQPDLTIHQWKSARKFHPVIFDSLDGESILKASLKTRGSAGPSGLDSDDWRRLLTGFGQKSDDLCLSIACTARKLCTQNVNSEHLSAYNASRLIPLDKAPGVRPIGIGEVIRRIIGKAVIQCVNNDILSAAGNTQLCCGQVAGIDHSIHSLRARFEKEECEGLLLIDAKNAFNSLNRQTALQNIKVICPSLHIILNNSYQEPSALFVNGTKILSKEGVTQGDPLAMPFYGLAILPLINSIQNDSVLQKWFADDGSAAGKIQDLKLLWDKVCEYGPGYGYFPNASKTVVVVKSHLKDAAEHTFSCTDIQICNGHKVLGSYIGDKASQNNFLCEWTKTLKSQINQLGNFASSLPHETYSFITKSFLPKVIFMSRTTPNLYHHLERVESAIVTQFLPVLTNNHIPNEATRELLSLPAREGGLAISNVCNFTSNYHQSIVLTNPLEEGGGPETKNAQRRITSSVNEKAAHELKAKIALLDTRLPTSVKKHRNCASEPGASSWLTSLPLKRYGFCLSKSEFRDALCIRYGWQPSNVPLKCPCGATFSIYHALNCHIGGYINLRHDSMRNLLSSFLKEVAHNVCVEPCLQPLSGERFRLRSTNTDANARLDLAANGVWGSQFEKTMCDVRIFSPFCISNEGDPKDVYRKHEQAKRREYEERVTEVERAGFVPLVFSCMGGIGTCANNFIKRLSYLIAEKRNEKYSQVITCIRTRISFAIQKAAILCLRGNRNPRNKAISNMDGLSTLVINAEAGIKTS